MLAHMKRMNASRLTSSAAEPSAPPAAPPVINDVVSSISLSGEVMEQEIASSSIMQQSTGIQHYLDASTAMEDEQQEQQQEQASSMSLSSLSSLALLGGGEIGTGGLFWKAEHFPHKMYDLLDDVARKGLESIISWSSGGKSFTIHNQVSFEKWIMPFYFSGMSSYKSFRRQLNLYGIYQHRHRPMQGANAYSHEHFIRGHRNLCDLIERRKKKKKKSVSGGGTTTTATTIKSKSAGFKKVASASTPNITTRNSKDRIEERNGLDGMTNAAAGGGAGIPRSNPSTITAMRNYSTTATTEEQMQRFKLEFLLRQQQHQQQQQQQHYQRQYHAVPLPTGTTTTTNPSNVDGSASTVAKQDLFDLLHYDEALIRPNPVNYYKNSNNNNNTDDHGSRNDNNNNNNSKKRKPNRHNLSDNNDNTNNTYLSFLKQQYWDDLPNGLSSKDVVEEIISTFQPTTTNTKHR